VIFVDTGAWFAAYVPSDLDHRRAEVWLDQNDQPLLTTDYIFDELLTLMKARGEFARAVAVGEKFFLKPPAAMHFVSPAEQRTAFEVFRRFRDKGWSFTDCVSYTVMQILAIHTAFAFDEHFRQFGTVSVVP
jgi:predicted nucleic acid-binding protein